MSSPINGFYMNNLSEILRQRHEPDGVVRNGESPKPSELPSGEDAFRQTYKMRVRMGELGCFARPLPKAAK